MGEQLWSNASHAFLGVSGEVWECAQVCVVLGFGLSCWNPESLGVRMSKCSIPCPHLLMQRGLGVNLFHEPFPSYKHVTTVSCFPYAPTSFQLFKFQIGLQNLLRVSPAAV